MIWNLKLIGYCPVDSGQILLVDPAYLKSWKDGNFKWDHKNDKEISADNDYHRACIVTCGPKRAGQTFNNLAVVTSTCHGDGNYPVYVTRDDLGRVTKAIIDFNSELDSELELDKKEKINLRKVC